jgi:hypothetical protein
MYEILVAITCLGWIIYLLVDYKIQKKGRFVKSNWSNNERDFIDVESKITDEEAEELKIIISQLIEERVKELDFSDTTEKFETNDGSLDINIKFNMKD